ncbi:hypothetical protein NIBR502770_11740 [Pseudarthrobacter sp. NIBRBAC000502770]|nr:hypothetical protein NIBR502770_11740 [Pseudarthrobacter sp. NIBRBAC000502770]
MNSATPKEPQKRRTAGPDSERPQNVDRDARAMQIAAAQLRLVTDRRLGKETPEWVRRLAAERPYQ